VFRITCSVARQTRSVNMTSLRSMIASSFGRPKVNAIWCLMMTMEPTQVSESGTKINTFFAANLSVHRLPLPDARARGGGGLGRVASAGASAPGASRAPQESDQSSHGWARGKRSRPGAAARHLQPEPRGARRRRALARRHRTPTGSDQSHEDGANRELPSR